MLPNVCCHNEFIFMCVLLELDGDFDNREAEVMISTACNDIIRFEKQRNEKTYADIWA